jgi:hypothetical protein
MRADITFEMPPQSERYHGIPAVTGFLRARVLTRPRANGQQAVLALRHGRPHAVHVLSLREKIAWIAVFHQNSGMKGELTSRFTASIASLLS